MSESEVLGGGEDLYQPVTDIAIWRYALSHYGQRFMSVSLGVSGQLEAIKETVSYEDGVGILVFMPGVEPPLYQAEVWRRGEWVPYVPFFKLREARAMKKAQKAAKLVMHQLEGQGILVNGPLVVDTFGSNRIPAEDQSPD